MSRMQFFVEQDGDGEWLVRATRDGLTVTVARHAERADAVAIASGANARILELAPPQRRTKTLGQQMAALRRELGAEPILGRNGRPYAVHHRNQHTD